jgi:catechol 2,3-dioxygenase-like lactoylglutathione lyase family enzyme
MKRIVAAILLSGVFSALLPVVASAGSLLPPDPQRAHVYLMRPDLEADERDVTATVDGMLAGRIGANQYLVVSLPPGEHELLLETGGAPNRQTLNIGPGDGAYVLLRVNSALYNYQFSVDNMPRDVAGRYLKKSESAGDLPVMLETVAGPYVAPAPPTGPATVAVAATPAVPVETSVGVPSGISIVTLGVQDLGKSVRFYTQGLGLSLSSHSNRDIAFFELSGSWLALYSRAALAADAGVPAGDAAGFTGITLAHNVADREAVDKVLKTAAEAGADIVKPAQDAFWGGYSGYFKDPDGYLWEVAWNPGLPLRR